VEYLYIKFSDPTAASVFEILWGKAYKHTNIA